MLNVNAIGLNFRDVLNILGMYPGNPGPPGGDMSGVVTAVGSAAHHLYMYELLSHRGLQGINLKTGLPGEVGLS